MKKSVAIIGAGYAGITSTVFIDHTKFDVTLYESTNHFGGRAFSYFDKSFNTELDNGQHMLMQCYHSTLKLFERLGISKELLIQKKARISYKTGTSNYAFKSVPYLPAPFHLLKSLLTNFKPLSILERLKLLIPSLTLFFPLRKKLKTISVEAWLKQLGQNEESIKYVWEPIAVGTMNDELNHLSAYTFKKLLKILFIESNKNTNVILSRVGLSELINKPFGSFMKTHSVNFVQKSVKKLIEKESSYEIQLNDNSVHAYDIIISTVPYFRLEKLLYNTRFPMRTTSIVSIYFLYTGEPLFEETFIGLPDSDIQWIFNKQKLHNKYTHVYSCTISAPTDSVLQKLNNTKSFVIDELSNSFSNFNSKHLTHVKMIHEKRATFSDSVIHKPTRPKPGQFNKNLFLCGDWTDTELPATIEGACLSALMMLEYVNDL